MIHKIVQVNEESPSGGHTERTIRMIRDESWQQPCRGNQGECFWKRSITGSLR